MVYPGTERHEDEMKGEMMGKKEETGGLSPIEPYKMEMMPEHFRMIKNNCDYIKISMNETHFSPLAYDCL
jgi:hypothetical protein